jgi:hypothetical protein
MICVSLLADQLAENIPFFNNGGHVPNTAQDLFGGKEMGAVLLRKIKTFVNSGHACRCHQRSL